MNLPAGTRLGPYELLSVLGAGGMGEVYKARDTRLERTVAVKVLTGSSSADLRQRFEREARAISSLNHPHICTVYDVGQQDGIDFLVMECLEGETLDHRIRDGLRLQDLLEISIGIAEALEFAHARSIIHRDIKPSNIFITSTGVAKVLDFGLAKISAVPAHAYAADETVGPGPSHLTSPGTTVGTVAYMSPEQARGDELDSRTDLFSLGAVMYQMATGHLPFEGKTSAVIFSAILERIPVLPTQIKPQLPLKLEEIILKALEKDRELRYQHASDIRADLKRLQRDSGSGKTAVANSSAVSQVNYPHPDSGSSVLVSSAKQHKVGTGVILMVALLVLSAAVFGLYSLLHHPTPPPFSQITVEKITDNGEAFLAAVSPDGKYVAHVLLHQGLQSVWLRHIETGSITQIVPASQARYTGLQISADGNYVFFSRYEREKRGIGLLYRVPVLGGTPQLLAQDIDSDFGVSADGKQVVFRRDAPQRGEQSIVAVNLNDSKERVLDSTKVGAFYTSNPAWSPDGQRVAVGKGGRPSGIELLDVSTGQQRIAGTPSSQVFATHVSWLNQDNIIVTGTNFQATQLVHIALLSTKNNQLREITTDTNNYGSAAATSDGKTLVAVQRQSISKLFIMNMDGSGIEDASAYEEDAVGVNWTTDGHILTTSGDAKGRIRNANGTDSQPLLPAWPGWIISASMCGPTNSLVLTAVSKTPDARPHIWRAAADGSNFQQLTFGETDLRPLCSADGKWVYYYSPGKGDWRVPLEGGTPVPVFSEGSRVINISRDGSRLLVFRIQGDSLQNFKTGYEVVSAQDLSVLEKFFQTNIERERDARFTPDGKSLLMNVVENGVGNLWLRNLKDGSSHQLTHFTVDGIPSFSISPDGKHIAMVRNRQSSNVIFIRDKSQ